MANLDFLRVVSEKLQTVLENYTAVESWIQTGILVLALFFGFIIRRHMRPSLFHWIDRSQLHFRLRTVLKNTTKLILPATAAAILYIFIQLKTLGLYEIETRIAEAALALLLAWVFIRVALQFIANTFLRQSVALVAWSIAALNIIGLADETTQMLEGIALNIGETKITALAVIKALILIFILLYAALFVAALIERRLKGVSSLSPSSRVLLIKLSRVLLLVFGLLIGVTSAGVDLGVLAVFGGAVGLGIGFGLQKGVSNLFSGILLLLDKSIKPGDILELPDSAGGNSVFGWVDEMGARYTSIVTRDNKSFLIPNEDFITQPVINWSHGDTLVRMDVTFGVHYESDPHKIIKLAKKAAIGLDRVVEEPNPVCHLTEFGDSSLNFALRFWIKDAEEGVTNIKGKVMLALWDTFQKNKIAIPYPHREVFVHNTK